MLIKGLILEYYPVIFSASRLGLGESPRLNIASYFEGGTVSNMDDIVDPRAVDSKAKVILPEFHLLGPLFKEVRLAIDRSY